MSRHRIIELIRPHVKLFLFAVSLPSLEKLVGRLVFFFPLGATVLCVILVRGIRLKATHNYSCISCL